MCGPSGTVVGTNTVTKRGRGTMTHSAVAKLVDNVKCKCCSLGFDTLAWSVRRNVATVRVVTWHTVHTGARLHLELHMRRLFNAKGSK